VSGRVRHPSTSKSVRTDSVVFMLSIKVSEREPAAPDAAADNPAGRLARSSLNWIDRTGSNHFGASSDGNTQWKTIAPLRTK